MEYISIWDQRNRRPIARGFKAAKIVAEFDRTKKIKIAEHTLGEIEFGTNPELNKSRNEVIDRDIGKLTTSGFQYENIGNVFSPNPEFLEKDSDNKYTVLGHGTPIEGDLTGGRENCAIEGLVCASGQGTNKSCNPGKCKLGKLQKITNYKWKYTSETGYPTTKVEYFVGGKEYLELKTIVRGAHTNKDGTEINVNKPASKGTSVYLPPVGYMGDLFNEDYLKVDQGGIITTEEDFVRQIIERGYKRHPVIGRALGKGGSYTSIADSPLSEEVYTAFLDFFFKLPGPWKKVVKDLADAKWEVKGTSHETNRVFIGSLFNTLKVKFTQAIQVTDSGWKESKIKYISDQGVRPTYLRLPGASLNYRISEDNDIIVVSEEKDRFNVNISALEIGTIVTTSDRKIAYQFLPRVIEDKDEREEFGMSPVLDNRTKEELYSPKDPKSWRPLLKDQLPKAPVAKWIMAGVDEFLREKKHDIDSFYFKYLDPTECSVKNIDWLAQHVGLCEPVWNIAWDLDYKRALIKNALGWFDKELINTVGDTDYDTIKGLVLKEAPFTSSSWRDTEAVESGDDTDISEIDLTKVAPSGFFKKDGTLTAGFSVYKKEWDGLMESKGSILTLVFLFSLFNVKAHSENELVTVGSVTKVRNGLRSYESNAPTLLPYKLEFLQTGTAAEKAVETYSNQLTAGSVVADLEGVKTTFFRMPFYYNRGGRTWDLVESISKYWVHYTMNSRVQYAYLAADLWRQGDAFFEAQLPDESIADTAAILSQDNNFRLIAEDGTTDILYN